MWADEGEGQYLYGSPSSIILHIQRFEQQQELWTKHHRRLEVPTDVYIPYSNDGILINKAGYKIVAMIPHHEKPMRADTLWPSMPVTTHILDSG